MTARLPRISPRSTSARLALAVAASFMIAFVLLDAGVYYAVSALLTKDAREVVRSESADLVAIQRKAGRDGLIAELRARAAASDDPDMLYALADPDGRIVAGNYARIPDHPAGARWIEFHDHSVDDIPRVVAGLQLLPDGDVLLTGLRMRSEDGFLALMLRIAIAALVVAALLGALAGWLTTRWVARRLHGLDATAARVGAGELGLRAQVDDSDDAFDRLAHRFNAMLDRIEDLLGGVRHATDHIAHDLRTPLTRLRHRLEQLRDRAEYEGSAATQTELEAAIAETDQLLQSFGALLRLARVEAQAPTPEAEPVDLHALAQDALELYAPIAGARDVALHDAVRATRVRGDADQLFQMLVNLLDNAVKFAPASSRVDVRLGEHEGRAVLEVADHGPGIPVEERERVFDRFVRLERHRGSPGSGLGLSLVRAIVLRHGGRVELLDNAPGLRVRIGFPSA